LCFRVDPLLTVCRLLSISPYYTSNGTRSASTLTRWLNETPVYLDAFEIVTEKARRLWWGQQLDLATVSWTMLLAIEGRRRQIPFLWAYALLSQLVGLSFAQNLFHVAMLLTPTPIALHDSKIARLLNTIFPPKPANWAPKPLFFTLSLILNFLATLSLPYAAGTTWFPAAIWLTKGLSLAPLVLPAIIPQSWGSTYSDYHESYGATTRLFQLFSTASALLHAKASVASILFNLPDAYKHRHSIRIPFDTEKRSAWERSATAFERVLGAMSDHPVVAAAGKDVLLSGLSIGLWAAVRAMDASDILQSAVPGYKAAENRSSHVPFQDAIGGADFASKSPTPAPEVSTTLRRGDRATSSRYSSVRSSVGPEENGTPAPTPRRRGRPRKVKPEPEHDPEEDADDATYEPTSDDKASVIGDVLPGDDFDWESAALAWGLTALGGLGTGSSAVYGAECISR
jgi:hypothetical protein